MRCFKRNNSRIPKMFPPAEREAASLSDCPSHRPKWCHPSKNESTRLSILIMCTSPLQSGDGGFNLLPQPPGLSLEAICQTTALITALWKRWNKTSSLHYIPSSCWRPHRTLLLHLQRECAVSCLSLRCRDSLTASQSNFRKQQSASAIFVWLLWSLVFLCWSSQTSKCCRELSNCTNCDIKSETTTRTCKESAFHVAFKTLTLYSWICPH